MNVKASNKYLFVEQIRSVKYFYIILIASVILLTMITGINVNDESHHTVSVSFSGMNITTIIYLFICGLCCFTDNFAMMMQNGVSRKSHFFGRVLTILQISAIMAVIDELLTIVLRLIVSSFGDHYAVFSLFDIWMNSDITGVLKFMNSFFFDFVFYSATFSFGLMITVIFYRLNKFWRTLLGVGVPVTLFVILPVLDENVTNGAISEVIGKLGRSVYQFAMLRTINSVLLFVAVNIVFLVISWLASRRAIINT